MASRAYHSPYRAAAAAATRAGVLRAALGLFTEHGYAATSMPKVAEAAGVTVATVYASVGSKADLVLALLETGSEHPAISPALGLVGDIDDPRGVVEALVAGVLGVQPDVLPLVVVVQDAARVEPRVAAALAEAEALARARFEEVVNRLRCLGALRPGMTPAKAVDVLWYYLGVPSWSQQSGLEWDTTEVQAFLVEQITYALARC